MCEEHDLEELDVVNELNLSNFRFFACANPQSRGAPLALAAPARGRSFQLADGFPDPWPESHALATPLVRLVALPHLTVPLNCPRLLPNASSQYHVLVWVFWVT